MSRKKKAEKRDVAPDCVHNSILVSKIINRIMKHGKKSTAEKIMYTALDYMQEKSGNCITLLEQAKENAKPKAELKRIRLGGTNVSMPINVGASRSESIFIMWIAKIVKKHKVGRPSSRVLSSILLDAAKGQGQLIKKKEDTHKTAEANRAYASQFRGVS